MVILKRHTSIGEGVDWKDADWSKSSEELAAELGCTARMVGVMRARKASGVEKVVELDVCGEECEERLKAHHLCGALIYVSYGGFFRGRFTHRRHYGSAKSLEIERCPGCGVLFTTSGVLSFLEMDRRIAAVMARSAGAAFDAETLAVVTALVERGEELEDVAALLDRDVSALLREIEFFAQEGATKSA